MPSGTIKAMTDSASTRSGAVRVRLDVSNAQAQQLLAAAGARRYAYNWALSRIVANHAQYKAEESYGIPKKERTRPFSFFDLVRQWDATKAEHTPWFGEHSTWTFRYAIRAAARAHADFLSGKTRFPKFRSRHRDRARFTVTDGLRLEPGRVRVAKYGWFRIAAPCPAQAKLRRLLTRGRARLMNVTVTQHSDGHWYATLCFERQVRVRPEDHTAPTGPVVGVDVGVKTAAVVAISAGEVVAELAASRALRGSLRKVKHLQRDLARTTKGSVNRRKAAQRLSRARQGRGTPGRRPGHVHRRSSPQAWRGGGGGSGGGEPAAQPPPGRSHLRPGLGRAAAPAGVQDATARRTARCCGPVLPVHQDVRTLRGSENQADPRRAHLQVRYLRPGHRPGRQRCREPRRLGRTTPSSIGVGIPGRGPPPGRPVSREASACLRRGQRASASRAGRNPR